MQRLVLFGLIVVVAGSQAHAEERYLDFVSALRERGYYDMAVAYLNQISTYPGLPEHVGQLIDFELGKSLLLQAAAERDPVRRERQLQRSREHLEKFLAGHLDHARAPEAMSELARILMERGRVAVLQANMPGNRAHRREFQEQARGFFEKTRKQFTEAEVKYRAQSKNFPTYVDPTQPGSKQLIEARREAQLNLMQAELNGAIVEYEFASSFDRGTPQSKEQLQAAIEKFKDVYLRYRNWLAGQYARMWMGKCYEEMGETGKAIGLYQELEKHEDPALDPLKRQVRYFHIICMNRRGDHVLTQEAAKRWLSENRSEARSNIGLGVQMELAKALREQALKHPENSRPRETLLKQALAVWTEVARYDSEFKLPALQERSKWGAVALRGGGQLAFEEVLSLAQWAQEEEKWSEAGAYFEAALSLVTPKQEISKVNRARYSYAHCLYQLQKYPEAALLCGHIALKHPDSELALRAAYFALAAWAQSYEATKDTTHRQADVDRVLRTARYLETRWPATPEANSARAVIGAVASSSRDYVAAAEAFARITPEDNQYLSAQGKAGEAYWHAYLGGAQAPDAASRTAELQSYLEKARALLTNARNVRLQRTEVKGLLPEDALRADLFLAQVHLESGEEQLALQLVEPLVGIVEGRQDSDGLELQVYSSAMQVYVRLEKLEQAEQMMNKIEATGEDTAEITALFQALAAELKKESERLEALGDQQAAQRTRQSFLAFLERLSGRKAGQTFDSLNWIAASLFGLGAYEQAEQVYRTMLSKYADDPTLVADPKKKRALAAAQLRLLTTLRMGQKYAEALARAERLLKENSKALDVIMEYGRVLSWSGTQRPGNYDTAIEHWRRYGARMGYAKAKPVQYYHCWLYLALSRIGKGGIDQLDRASHELNFVLETMSKRHREWELDGGFEDLLGLAAQLGISDRPQTLGQFFKLLLAHTSKPSQSPL